jgi:hypothetical protein
VAELKRHAAPAHPCLTCGQAADERTLYCPSCWDRRRVVLTFDPDRLRRHEERAARTAAALAERFCEACGFSSWRVSPRGDASCYACDLIREGRPLRCTGCGGQEWRRDEHRRRACATCPEGDARVRSPSRSRLLSQRRAKFPSQGAPHEPKRRDCASVARIRAEILAGRNPPHTERPAPIVSAPLFPVAPGAPPVPRPEPAAPALDAPAANVAPREQ